MQVPVSVRSSATVFGLGSLTGDADCGTGIAGKELLGLEASGADCV